MVISGLAVISYATGNLFFSDYLNIPYLPGTGELVIICGAIIGSGIGFYGTTPIQHKFLWVMLALWLWVQL